MIHSLCVLQKGRAGMAKPALPCHAETCMPAMLGQPCGLCKHGCIVGLSCCSQALSLYIFCCFLTSLVVTAVHSARCCLTARYTVGGIASGSWMLQAGTPFRADDLLGLVVSARPKDKCFFCQASYHGAACRLRPLAVLVVMHLLPMCQCG